MEACCGWWDQPPEFHRRLVVRCAWALVLHSSREALTLRTGCDTRGGEGAGGHRGSFLSGYSSRRQLAPVTGTVVRRPSAQRDSVRHRWGRSYPHARCGRNAARSAGGCCSATSRSNRPTTPTRTRGCRPRPSPRRGGGPWRRPLTRSQATGCSTSSTRRTAPMPAPPPTRSTTSASLRPRPGS